MPPRRPSQLPLKLGHDPALGIEDFHVLAANRSAYEYLMSWPNWTSRQTLLIGPEACGKTHLATIWAQHSGGVLIDGAALEPVDGHAALVSAKAVCVEDVDRRPKSDSLLFHFLNAARVANAQVLMTARSAPDQWQRSLPDLISRARAATPLVIAEADEAGLRFLLVKLLADRDLAIEPRILDYIMVRLERSHAAVAALVRKLDELTLAAKRPITKPMVAMALDMLGFFSASKNSQSESG